MTAEAIAAACGGDLIGTPPPEDVSEIVIDSRKITPGSLFAAIRGERADGNDYVKSALENGAACALAERIDPHVPGCVILVRDTISALQQIAGFYRAQFSIPVLGVTGSVGKTTAKEMCAAVLSRRFSVHKTAGNYNNDLGVPLTLFGLREDHEAAVVELGVSHPGDMSRIAAIAKPTMALYTNIGDAHLEYLGSRRVVFEEKTGMNRFLPEDGVVFCNGDDPLLAELNSRQKKITYGLGNHNAVRADSIEVLPDGNTRCVIRMINGAFPVTIPAFGEHVVYAALGAAAVGEELGLNAEEIADGIRAFRPVGSRARLLRTKTLTVIDDCYNANPTSTAAALRSLSRLSGRKVAILGDMLELGPESAAMHRETGSTAKSCGIDLVLTTGEQARFLSESMGKGARHFETKQALLDALPEFLLPGDNVLVKASHSAHFEDITEKLQTL